MHEPETSAGETNFFLNLTDTNQSLLRLIRQINSKTLVKEFIPRDGLESCTIMRKDPRFASRAPGLAVIKEDKPTDNDFENTLPSSPLINERTKAQPSSSFDVLSNYTFGHRLGQGVNSVVWHAVHEPTLTEVAMKSYKNDEEARSRILREVNVLKFAKHPNIIRCLGKIETPKWFYVVIEYIEGRTLSQYLRAKVGSHLSEEEANSVFKQILSALAYCHRHNICHRDLKLDNILITNNQEVKIVDFGFATCRPASMKSTLFCGTPHYMAPEIIAGVGYAGPPVDVWALGVVLYYLLMGKYPFDGVSEAEIFNKVRKGKYSLATTFSAKIREFIARMLELDPRKRATTEELARHRWVNSTFLELHDKH